MDRSIIEELRDIPLFSALLQSENDCPAFIKRGEMLDFAPEDRVVEEGAPGAFYVVVAGEIQVLKRSGQSEIFLAMHTPGSFFGESPIVLGTGFFAAGKAGTDARVWKLSEEDFWLMLSSCPSVTRQIMQTMAFRVRNLESVSQTSERLVSLGTMAAGLAHELNNPASGARHATRDLKSIAAQLPSNTCHLHGLDLKDETFEKLADITRELLPDVGKGVELSPLERSDREAEIGDWLYDRKIDDDDIAASLVSALVPIEWLEKLEAEVETVNLGPVLKWICGNLSLEEAANAVEESTKRISEIVARVKTYSHLDQSPVGQFGIKEGLYSTLKMLNHKLRDVELSKDIPCDLPDIWGYEAELNQVWTNLLDNAADAALNGQTKGGEKAKIRIIAGRNGDCITVKIENNGNQIADDVKKRLFEPFFTTKGVGKGTGLGLSTCYRIIKGRHSGNIVVESDPEKTSFTVYLPIKKAV